MARTLLQPLNACKQIKGCSMPLSDYMCAVYTISLRVLVPARALPRDQEQHKTPQHWKLTDFVDGCYGSCTVQ